MLFGLTFGNVIFGDGAAATAFATAAEASGFESLWTVEHVVVPAGYRSTYPYSDDGRMPGPDDMGILDSLVWLSYVAASTSTIKLATGVTVLPQRSLLYTAKECASLDHLSGGRLIIGVGSGWMREEFAAVGVPFESRGARLDEYIRALRVLWKAESPSFDGQFVSFEHAYCRPQPINGHIPVVVGGHSPRAARRAGELADGFCPGTSDPDTLARCIMEMRTAAETAGRDPDSVEISALGNGTGPGVERLLALGVHRIILPPPVFDPATIGESLAQLAEVVISRVA